MSRATLIPTTDRISFPKTNVKLPTQQEVGQWSGVPMHSLRLYTIVVNMRRVKR